MKSFVIWVNCILSPAPMVPISETGNVRGNRSNTYELEIWNERVRTVHAISYQV